MGVLVEPAAYIAGSLREVAKRKTLTTRFFLVVTAAICLLVSPGAAPALAGDGKGKISKQIRNMFERFDSNRDGQIDAEEFKDVQTIRFYTADMENDGQISWEELVFVRGVPAERANTAFNRLDSNGNDQLSVNEFNASRTSAFAALDLNGDRSISPREVDQFAVAKGADDLHGSESSF